jgi:serine/threonine protein kinase
MGNSYIGPYVE